MVYGVVIIALGIFSLARAMRLHCNRVHTTAKVIKVERRWTIPVRRYSATTFRYYVQGVMYKQTRTYSFSSYKVGDSVEIIYHKNDPKVMTANGIWHLLVPLIFIIGGGVLMVFRTTFFSI
ncbi:MAG: hypothetical protein FWG38_05810 [Defluviitaleaceae bacterium]|nr:hypothetical protein [Defluviitaleaceae bacterium]